MNTSGENNFNYNEINIIIESCVLLIFIDVLIISLIMSQLCDVLFTFTFWSILFTKKTNYAN